MCSSDFRGLSNIKPNFHEYVTNQTICESLKKIWCKVSFSTIKPTLSARMLLVSRLCTFPQNFTCLELWGLGLQRMHRWWLTEDFSYIVSPYCHSLYTGFFQSTTFFVLLQGIKHSILCSYTYASILILFPLSLLISIAYDVSRDQYIVLSSSSFKRRRSNGVMYIYIQVGKANI